MNKFLVFNRANGVTVARVSPCGARIGSILDLIRTITTNDTQMACQMEGALDFLEDGAALAAAGITDADINAIEYVRAIIADHNMMEKSK